MRPPRRTTRYRGMEKQGGASTRPAKLTQSCSLGSSQSLLAMSFDALLGGLGGRLVTHAQLSACHGLDHGVERDGVEFEPFLGRFDDGREQLDALIWFGFAGVDNVLLRVNRLEYPTSIDTLDQSHVCSQRVSGVLLQNGVQA